MNIGTKFAMQYLKRHSANVLVEYVADRSVTSPPLGGMENVN